jgi:hypothetical protein
MDALQETASGGAASDPFLRNVLAAQIINRVHGGAVVSAWDVADLDETMIDVFYGLVQDLPQLQQGEARAQTVRMEWLRSHPSYGKSGLLVRH